MALIKCPECEREISDKALACPGCGFPVAQNQSPSVFASETSPSLVRYDKESDLFLGTMNSVIKLAMRAVQDLGWKLDQVNENLGLVTFQTGISFGSWSGVSCSLDVQQVETERFQVTGTGKQNLGGGQVIALNIGGEAQSKARDAINRMKIIASPPKPAAEPEPPKAICYNCAQYKPGRWDQRAGKCLLHKRRVVATNSCDNFSLNEEREK